MDCTTVLLVCPTLYPQGYLFIHRKTFKKRPKMLDEAKYRLQRNTWSTGRTALLMEKYALTEENVVDLHHIFKSTDFKVTTRSYSIPTCIWCLSHEQITVRSFLN